MFTIERQKNQIRLVQKKINETLFLSPSLQCCDVSLINLLFLEMCVLSNNIMDYNFVAQGKTTIPNVDDAEECRLTDVSER